MSCRPAARAGRFVGGRPVPGGHRTEDTHRVRGRFLAIFIAIAISFPGTAAPALGAPSDFHSQWLGQSPYPTLGSGTAASYTVTFRNTGTAPWRRGDPANQVNLGIAGDSRLFFDLGMAVSWLSDNRIATTSEESVAPGATGTFTFMVRAPLTPGVYVVPL